MRKESAAGSDTENIATVRTCTYM